MLTQKPPAAEPSSEPTPDTDAPRKGARPLDDTVCWFEGRWTPLAEAKVSIMTHAFLYGTAVFEGIRGYWNADDEQLYLLKARPHFERIVDSSKILLMHPGYSVDEMVELAHELLRRNAYREG
jgi:branched-chain amino acid aminotransferase